MGEITKYFISLRMISEDYIGSSLYESTFVRSFDSSFCLSLSKIVLASSNNILCCSSVNQGIPKSMILFSIFFTSFLIDEILDKP